MIKAALFDLDNTLIDFMLMKRRSCKAAISAMVDAGLDIGEKKALTILYELYDKYGMEDHNIFQKLLRKVEKKIDHRILAHGINAYRAAQTAYMVPYANVVPTLIKLKEMGLRLAIVTDAPRMKAYMRLVELRILDFFDFVVAIEDSGAAKPNPKPFKMALNKLKTRPDETLFVGDMPDKDILGAKKVGLVTVHAKYGHAKKATVKADYTMRDISKLADIVYTLNSEKLNL